MERSPWLEDYEETLQCLLEDVFLLDVLAQYISRGSTFLCDEQAGCFPQVFRRLCDYLSQHALDLRNLSRRIGVK